MRCVKRRTVLFILTAVLCAGFSEKAYSQKGNSEFYNGPLSAAAEIVTETDIVKKPSPDPAQPGTEEAVVPKRAKTISTAPKSKPEVL